MRLQNRAIWSIISETIINTKLKYVFIVVEADYFDEAVT